MRHDVIGLPYLPEDPTIPRPDQYGNLSIGDLLVVCEFWRFGAMHWLRREKPDEFRRVFDSLLPRHDPAIQSMRELIIKGEVELARSAYYFSAFKFENLTGLVVRACKDFGVDPQPVHEFFEWRDADLEKAIRAVGLLEWRLKGELTREPTANPEPEEAEHEEPPAEDPQGAEVMTESGALEHITLDQAGALIQRSKRTVEGYLADGKLPRPDVEGGHGKPHEWLYDNIRPALENIFGKLLPTKFPASRLPQIRQ